MYKSCVRELLVPPAKGEVVGKNIHMQRSKHSIHSIDHIKGNPEVG